MDAAIACMLERIQQHSRLRTQKADQLQVVAGERRREPAGADPGRGTTGSEQTFRSPDSLDDPSVDSTVDSSSGIVVTLNPEILMRARREPSLQRILAGALLVIPDGVGLVRALRRRGWAGAQRVAGVDLLETYLPGAVACGHRLALVGAAPGVAHRAAQAICSRFPGLTLVLVDDGAPDAALAARIAQASPDVVLAAFGGGRQERFLDEYLAGTGAAVGIGVGGTFDFWAGDVVRAPRILRERGFEWLWRLIRQPWRLRRQLVLPVFWLLEHSEARRIRNTATTPLAERSRSSSGERGRGPGQLPGSGA